MERELTSIRIETPRPLTKEEMERAKKAVEEIAGKVKKVHYPASITRIEK